MIRTQRIATNSASSILPICLHPKRLLQAGRVASEQPCKDYCLVGVVFNFTEIREENRRTPFLFFLRERHGES